MVNKKLLDEFIEHTYIDWVNEVEQSLKGISLNKLITKTYDNLDIQPIYFPDSIDNFQHLKNQYPGIYPFVRTGNLTGYKIEKWKIAQEFLVENAEEYNEALKNNIFRDQDSIIIDDFRENNLKIIKNIYDFEKLFHNIDLNNKYFLFRLGLYPYAYLSFFLAFLEKHNDYKLVGSLEYDYIDLLLEYGFLPYSFSYSLEQLINILNYSMNHLQDFKTINITSRALSYGGSNVVLEIAYLLAKGIFYLNELINSGFKAEEIIPRIKFNVFSSPNFFFDIAKIRSFRLLWSRVLKEYTNSYEDFPPYIHFTTNIYNKTKLDIENNILRNTTESLAGILSNCDMITTHSYTFPYFENEFSRRIAINTQLILKYECNITDTIDPAGGSYYIENLTNNLAEIIWSKVQEIESRGNILNCIETGWLQDQILLVASNRKNNLDNRKDILVGVNKYPNPNENIANLTLEKNIFDSSNTEEAIKKGKSKKSLSIELKNVSELAKQGLSTEEIINLIYNIYNDDTQKTKVKPIKPLQLSSHFENLKLIVEEYKIKHGFYPKCFLANLGKLSEYKSRADFANDFLRVAGLEIIYTDGFSSIEDCAKAFFESQSRIMVICSSDDIYIESAQRLSRLVKKAKPLTYIILAGNPMERIEEYKNSGIDQFIHIKSNIFDTLKEILNNAL